MDKLVLDRVVVRKCLGSGDPPGLQNRWSFLTGDGVFDSHALPPITKHERALRVDVGAGGKRNAAAEIGPLSHGRKCNGREGRKPSTERLTTGI